MKTSLKTFLLFGCLSFLSMPAWANPVLLTHDELIVQGLEFLVDEEILQKEEAACLVLPLKAAMREIDFDNMMRLLLLSGDPSEILAAPYKLSSTKRRLIYQKVHDDCLQYFSVGVEKKSDENLAENIKTETN